MERTDGAFRGFVIVALVALLALAVFTAAALWSHPRSSHGEVTFTTEAPSVAPQGMVSKPDRGKITTVRHRIRFTRLPSRATGPCYRVDATVIGDNAAIDEIVTGTGRYHWCVRRDDQRRLVDRYTYVNKDHTESWGWTLTDVDVNAGRGWSSKWCLSPGEQGPCYPVQYRYQRFTFRWARGISVFGQDIKMHKGLIVACTMRGNPGGYLCTTGDV